jgi:hypothetical protein
MEKLNLSPETLNKLKHMTNNSEDTFCFLGYTLYLTTGKLQDELQQKVATPQIKNSTMYNLLN